MSSSAPATSLHLDVRFTRGTFQLSLDAVIAPGVTVLFGPSGAGKSTVLDLVAGLLRPREGRIALGPDAWFDSASHVDRPARDRRVGYLFQSLALFPHKTVWQNATYSPRATDASAKELLERLGVIALRDRRVDTLSGGERQRVALARALASQPSVLLLDEPLSALDRPRRGESLSLIRTLVRERNLPALYVTHDHEEAEAVGDALVQMNNGVAVRSGAPSEVLEEAPSWGAASIGLHGNRFEGSVLGGRGEDGETLFRAGEVTLHARPSLVRAGEKGVFMVRANDVTLSLDPPGRTSAGNVLEGVITAIAPDHRAVIVSIDAGVPLQAEVTPAAAKRLSLEVGMRVWALFKTRACHVVASESH